MDFDPSRCNYGRLFYAKNLFCQSKLSYGLQLKSITAAATTELNILALEIKEGIVEQKVGPRKHTAILEEDEVVGQNNSCQL